MGRPVDLLSTKIDLSHQEMDRLISEMQAIWDSITQGPDGPTGVEWLPVEGIGRALCEDLGYEDMPEFEDALNGSFSDFLDLLPHVRKDKRADGREYFQLVPEPPQTEWRPTRHTFRITSTKDLWRVCLKSPYARIEIPELEFEISADGKRHIDSIYNHVGAAIFNLGSHVRQSRGTMSDDVANKIMDTVMALNILLDVPTPWTWVVHDPSGSSELKPEDGVQLLSGDAAQAAGADGAGAEPAAATDATQAAAAPAAADGVATVAAVGATELAAGAAAAVDVASAGAESLAQQMAVLDTQ